MDRTKRAIRVTGVPQILIPEVCLMTTMVFSKKAIFFITFQMIIKTFILTLKEKTRVYSPVSFRKD